MLILLHQPETTASFGSIHRLCHSNYGLSMLETKQKWWHFFNVFCFTERVRVMVVSDVQWKIASSCSCVIYAQDGRLLQLEQRKTDLGWAFWRKRERHYVTNTLHHLRKHFKHAWPRKASASGLNTNSLEQLCPRISADSLTHTHTILIHPAKEQPHDSAAEKGQHILTTLGNLLSVTLCLWCPFMWILYVYIYILYIYVYTTWTDQ